MGAAAVVVPIIVDTVIGEAVASAVGEQVLGSTLLADATTGAIKGAASGAITAAAKEGDIAKGALGGAAGGAVGGAVAPAVTSAVGDTVSPEAAKAIGKGAGTAASTLARGGDLKAAGTSGLITGGVEALFGAPEGASTADKAISSIEKGFASTALQDLFKPSAVRTSSTVGAGTTPTPGTSPTATGVTPGSQALAQALNLGDVGAPIFGGDKEKGKAKPTWNVESLRYMGGDGTETA
jgi:hypothetical protein